MFQYFRILTLEHTMKFLTPTLHGLGDYAAAAALILGPLFLGIAEQSVIAHWFSIAGGIGLIVYSLLTDYTFSIAKAIPFKAHLLLDAAAGVAFLALPFVLGLDGVVRLYFFVMGAGVLFVVAVSDSQTAVNPA